MSTEVIGLIQGIREQNTPLDGNSSTDNPDQKHQDGAVSDEELLSVACSDPEEVPGLLSRGGNPGARDPETGTTVLHCLVEHGAEEDVLETVLKKLSKEQINALDNRHRTALLLAVTKKQTETVRVLLNNGASMYIQEQTVHALHHACYLGYVDMARLLIDHGADPTELDDGMAPIHYAIAGNFQHIVSLLLDKGVKVDAPAESEGFTPLIVAAWFQYEDMVEYLVSDKGAQVNKAQRNTAKENETDLDAVTPLQLACRWNLIKSVKLLISKNADAGAADSKGRTALYRAAGYASAELIDLLLEKNVAIINKMTDKGRTPLMKAIRRDNYAAIEKLIASGADVNIADKEGLSPLILALWDKQPKTVQKLLAREGINVNLAGKDGWTPLMIASTVEQDPVTVRRILELKASVEEVDTSGLTALHKASYLGHGDIVHILLKEGHSNPLKTDKILQNALHKAARRGYAGIVRMILDCMGDVDAVDLQDNRGWTALHYASHCQARWTELQEITEELGDHNFLGYGDVNERDAGCYEDVVGILLKHKAKVHVRNKDSETPLHLAARPGAYKEERMKILLSHIEEHHMSFCLTDILTPKGTPDTPGSALRPPEHQEDLQRRLIVWAAEKRETHRFVPLLVRTSKRFDDAERIWKVFYAQEPWNALQWAAYTGDGQLVWQLLHTMEQTPHNDKDRHSALKIAEDLKQRLEAPPGKSQRRIPMEMGATALSRRRKDDDTGEHRNAPKDMMEEYQKTIDVLRDPPFVPTSITPSDPYEKAKPSIIMGSFDATISDFYAKGSQTGFLRRNRSVKEVICDKSPGTIMKDAREWIRCISKRLEKLDGEEDKVFADKDFKFRWIHLPANNMQWMNELVTAIGKEEDRSEEDYRALKSFFKKSWQEIPHGSSMSRLMKPDYSAAKTPWPCPKRVSSATSASESTVKEKKQPIDFKEDSSKPNASEESPHLKTTSGNPVEEFTDKDKGTQGQPSRMKGDGTKSKQDTQEEYMTAIYIPYIRFGKIDTQKADDAKYEDLEKEYGEKVHGARTLDEFYYHTASAKELKKDMDRRNKDQVVSKELHGDDLKNGKLLAWKLLRIDELWIWVINRETIITASTYCPDQVSQMENLALVILKELGKEPGTSKSRTQPDSAQRMSEFIVDSCVKFYTTRKDSEVEVDDCTPKDLSTHQIFADALNKMAIKEAELFEVFTEDNKKGQGKGQVTNEHRSTQIGKTATLLCQIKDIRDELRIIGTLARHQKTVQDRLLGRGQDVQRSADFVIREITEMDKVAESLQNAVSTTLTLQQSETAIAQSETAIAQSTETVQQGRTLMVFTVTTILFLPMSFFTSLFAVNITEFQHDGNGQLLYQPEWIFPIIFGISIPIWIACLLYAYWAGLRKWLPGKKTTSPPTGTGDGGGTAPGDGGGDAGRKGGDADAAGKGGIDVGISLTAAASSSSHRPIWKNMRERVAASLRKRRRGRQKKEGGGDVDDKV